jgi:uncharacterized protein
MKNLNNIDITAFILVIVGALNWGSVGIFGFDLVAAVFGEMSTTARVVYSLVGVMAFYLAATSFSFAKKRQFRLSLNRNFRVK